MKLRIVSGHEEGGIRPGLRIHIAVSPILGIRMRWITEIGEVRAPYEFTDTQPKGPFAEWNHMHRFREVDGGVEIIDELQYRLPLGVLGRLAHVLFVRKQIEGIFEHRRRTLERRFAR